MARNSSKASKKFNFNPYILYIMLQWLFSCRKVMHSCKDKRSLCCWVCFVIKCHNGLSSNFVTLLTTLEHITSWHKNLAVYTMHICEYIPSITGTDIW